MTEAQQQGLTIMDRSSQQANKTNHHQINKRVKAPKWCEPT